MRGVDLGSGNSDVGSTGECFIVFPSQQFSGCFMSLHYHASCDKSFKMCILELMKWGRF